MFNSHTSYEFGNPYPPYQVPLSRLEFPLTSVWPGFEARRRLGRFSVGLDYLTSLSNQETNNMRDSDWDDDSDTNRVSIYSESGCRLRPSFKLQADIDMLVSDLLGMPPAFELRPVVGYRWQHFSFITHTGTQYEYYDPVTVTPLPGNGIDFQQDWCMLFVRTKLGYTWSHPPLLHHIKLKGQADWSHVWGYNIDRHLLRVGDRTTREYTLGDAWHASLEVLFGLTERLDLGVTGDYMRIETTGVHKLTMFDYGFRFSHGVRAWSEQSSITLKLAYSF